MNTPSDKLTWVGERARGARAKIRRAFTLVEVMLSVFILAIGMIMVITIFPVGGDWTRQATESTISQAVAQNALAIIQSHYPQNKSIPVLSTTVVPFPGIGSTIPASELCYQFGSDKPFPADPAKANYFWTALVRMQNTGEPQGSTLKYDVYILVFKKGSPSHTYSNTNFPTGFAEVPATRTGNYAPATITGPYTSGVYDSDSGKVVAVAASPGPPATPPVPLVPAVGEYGIGVESGTVFRQSTLSSNGVPTGASPRPFLKGQVNPSGTVSEAVICGDPLMNGTAIVGPSPLVYVYQTTVSWKAP